MKWAIICHRVGQPARASDAIESSKGKPRNELLALARRLNSNGEGLRYTVAKIAD